MYRVLVLTDAINLQSGLARCGRELISKWYIDPRFEVWQAGWHSMGLPHPYPVQIYPVERFAADEKDRILNLIEQLKPHYVVAIGDPFYFSYLRHIKEKTAQMRHRCDWIGWITIDGDPVHPGQLQHLLPFDRVLFMSEFARNETLKAVELAKEQSGNYVREIKRVDGKDVKVPHDPYELHRLERSGVLYPGVDADAFKVLHPIPLWEPPQGEPYNRHNKFVCLIVDQNTSRKAVGVAIDAYMKFREGKRDKVRLHMVTNPSDPNGINLNELLSTVEHGDVTIHPNSPTTGMSEEELNQIYNVATCLFSATSGEGFKLPMIEAMAANCLVVLPDYTSPSEVIRDKDGYRGVLITAPADTYWYGSFTYRKRVIPVTNVVEALERAFALWEAGELEPILQRARIFANTHSWGRTFNGMNDAFRYVYEEQPIETIAI